MIQHVLTILVFLSWVLLLPRAPGLQLRLGASDCAPGQALCFMGPWTFASICCPQFPHHPHKTGRTAQVFAAQEGTRRFLAPAPSRGRPHPTRRYLDPKVWVCAHFSCLIRLQLHALFRERKISLKFLRIFGSALGSWTSAPSGHRCLH